MKLAALILTLSTASTAAQFLNRFNYDETVERDDGYKDYGPRDWGRISCNENSRLDECIAYPDKWHEGNGWRIKENYCRWCPETGNSCGRHHQSPYNVVREVGLWGSPKHKECIDWHWMKYEDSTCTISELERTDAFKVERFALRVNQPVEVRNDDSVRLDCEDPTKANKRKFGRIDYSKGFSQWWFLSHIDFKIPSEHTQDGKRYDAEAQMYHWYSAAERDTGVGNEMGTVSVFLDVYDDVPPYRELDRLICQWRKDEERTREECGLPPIVENYGPCFPNIRGSTARNGDGTRRNMRGGEVQEDTVKVQKRKRQKFANVNELLIHNHQYHDDPNVTKPVLLMDPANWDEAEEKDWGAYIQSVSDEFDAYEKQWKVKVDQHGEEKALEHVDDEHRRRLVDNDELDWFNYFLMLGVRTEYYHRISGTQTIPPCYGRHLSGTRKQTNHWRVLKDPIRIHGRQLAEMQRLIRERIAPADDPVRGARCKPDTAAKVDRDGNVNVARPLQETDVVNYSRFCECHDWGSKWPQDRNWCQTRNNYTRFYENIYNFQTDDEFDKPRKPNNYK